MDLTRKALRRGDRRVRQAIQSLQFAIICCVAGRGDESDVVKKLIPMNFWYLPNQNERDERRQVAERGPSAYLSVYFRDVSLRGHVGRPNGTIVGSLQKQLRCKGENLVWRSHPHRDRRASLLGHAAEPKESTFLTCVHIPVRSKHLGLEVIVALNHLDGIPIHSKKHPWLLSSDRTVAHALRLRWEYWTG
ncbi:hypothetical protein PISMIDRAFT_12949 [Pisolithus microcarpus 441]|uniref:Uncharacterized protein n=1 Tax=Pisolithus microcarpus 441 TaxID=765257 RepID=A0A0C9Z2Q1_9AGAM|nr:hypothetical protein PISMIDRAFT_12949 [Pisolithus microcarpus 441]